MNAPVAKQQQKVSMEREPSLRGEERIGERLLASLAGRLLLHFPESDFLRRQCEGLFAPLPKDPCELAERLAQTGDQLLAAMDDPRFSEQPLVRVVRAFGLSPFELDLMLVALAPELDERYGNLYAGINGGLRRLSLHQAIPLLVADSTERGLIRESLADSALWRCGLLVDTPSTPLFERRLQAAAALSDYIGDRPSLSSRGAVLHLPANDPSTALVIELLVSVNAEARELANWAAAERPLLIHLVDRDGTGSGCHADALALALQRPWLELRSTGEEIAGDCCQLLIAARLAGLLPVLRLEGTVGEVELAADALAALAGPLLVIASDSVALRIPETAPLRRWLARIPRPLEMVAVWHHYLAGAGAQADVDLLANQTRLPVALIARVVEQASARALSAGRAGVEHKDIVQSLRENQPELVSRLASSHRPRVPWSALVLENRYKASLESLVERVRYRVEVQDRWGLGRARFGNRGNGLVALLHGESGTGKTFAAQVIASRLGLSMLSVDLSRVVSKYIGETEKHLNELFDLGEGFRALLFFDEADALFGKRTNVKDAHDRYANIEVNFLLQRLESFEGIVLLSSNFQQSMDDAFTRRIGFSVFFPRPTPGQRLALWRQHLPRERLGEDLRLEKIAERYDLVGGEIRNCALTAAYAAAADGGVVSQQMVEAAIASEFNKMGRPLPRGLGPAKSFSS
ncbi:MAG: ATP-binding protein [Candidatus Thiodiazotropha sp. (ex Ctena orbiculata)]|nr:ATP-binding protein [Candidatus Thiodiazotropha taylori]MBT2997654.1 ATP-binding protein [Candidatus Thiodiazotropha taylori]MBT3001925.1 ATP-binding protein [Candidatus Thiodiazotropha taylori]MBT3026313.1 ATP-binding protein [Candidatus Thiodiazotropha taylori]MBT3035756.1 ATP-binding protein [Candidatus Thiodiazotropha taylori]